MTGQVIDAPTDFAKLEALLALTPLENDAYRGTNLEGDKGRTFGGQVIAQALMSAGLTCDDARVPHSLHAYFLRAGKGALPIDYHVTRDLEGGSFSNRHVVASQEGRPILRLSTSFKKRGQGLTHTMPMPDVPPPEAVETEGAYLARNLGRIPQHFADQLGDRDFFEIRYVAGRAAQFERKQDGPIQMWFRARGAVNATDPLSQRALLAYITDMNLLSTAALKHGLDWVSDGFQAASLDHALWFHGAADVSDWLLFVADSPWADNGLGLNRGSVFSRAGTLVASVMQEGVMRIARP